MIYDVNDNVRVFWEGELYHEPVKIIWVSDDEETFELESKEGNIFQNVKRKEIFEDWETEKLTNLLAEKHLEIDSMTMEDIYEGLAEGNIDTSSDATLEGVSQAISDAFSDVDTVNEYFKREFGYYGLHRFVKVSDVYYWIKEF